ncbi:MAG: lipase secretion chaperone [Pseudomonadota bacterium]
MQGSTGIKFGALAALAGAALLLLATRSTPLAAPPSAQRAHPDYFPFVRSMEGTHPDGDIKVAPGDALVVDAELARLFEYYLAGQGERTLTEIRLETEREIERRLKPRAAAEAKQLLAQYWRYKEALVGLEARLGRGDGSADSLRKRIAARNSLRADFFSAAQMAGLFGFDDAYDADALERLAIAQDKSLGPERRRQKLGALDAALAPALREEREAPRRVLALEESVQRLRAQGASDDEVYRARAAATSPEAAARLAEVDRDERAWKARINSYQAERAAILARAAPDQQSALSQLRDARFTPDEQRRLGAYE